MEEHRGFFEQNKDSLHFDETTIFPDYPKPTWELYAKQCEWDADTVEELKKLNDLHDSELTDALGEHRGLLEPLLYLVKKNTQDPRITDFVLTLLNEYVKEDPARNEEIIELYSAESLYKPYLAVLSAHASQISVNAACSVLSGLICYAPAHYTSNRLLHEFLDSLCERNTMSLRVPSTNALLDTLINLLKQRRFRAFVWERIPLMNFIEECLVLSESSAATVYRAVFCVWLLSFTDEYCTEMAAKPLVESICKLIKETRVEKVVRIVIKALSNLIEREAALEYAMDSHIANTVAILEYEKWKDEDLYDLIHEFNEKLQSGMHAFSIFARYMRELDSGNLKWTVLHSADFIKTNIMQFETNEFHALRRLTELLSSPSVQTKSIACHDIGQFARCHPSGQLICDRLGIKRRIIDLARDGDRQLAREALLCVQSMILGPVKLARAGSLLVG